MSFRLLWDCGIFLFHYWTAAKSNTRTHARTAAISLRQIIRYCWDYSRSTVVHHALRRHVTLWRHRRVRSAAKINQHVDSLCMYRCRFVCVCGCRIYSMSTRSWLFHSQYSGIRTFPPGQFPPDISPRTIPHIVVTSDNSPGQFPLYLI